MAALKVVLVVFAVHCTVVTASDKSNFENFFTFKSTNNVDVMNLIGKSNLIETHEDRSMHSCKHLCSDNGGCFGALFTQRNDTGCTPDTCTEFHAREARGRCHLLGDKESEDGSLKQQLDDKLYMWHLNFPVKCRPSTWSDGDSKGRKLVSVKRDDEDETCFRFTYTCDLGYEKVTGMEDEEVKCCEGDEKQTHISLNCQEKTSNR